MVYTKRECTVASINSEKCYEKNKFVGTLPVYPDQFMRPSGLVCITFN